MTSKIDFYILNQADEQNALIFSCQLIEKLYCEQQRIYIHTLSLQKAEYFEDLLWTYKEGSFIPHQLYRANTEKSAPIQIGCHAFPQQSFDILINLSPEFPSVKFPHIIEIVFSDTNMQQLARERYRQYRDQGFEINTYKK